MDKMKIIKMIAGILIIVLLVGVVMYQQIGDTNGLVVLISLIATLIFAGLIALAAWWIADFFVKG
jgi:uncharacterized membrane protein YccC